MIVVDTNVLSELLRPVPARPVVAWLDDKLSADIVTTAITAAELRAGVAVMAAGRRRNDIGERIEQLLLETFEDQILAFDAGSSIAYAEIVSIRKALGDPISSADAQIAAICRSREAVLATRNTVDFVGIDINLVNPWER